MARLPLLTIGIPAYNEEKFLAKTLESILRQTFSDFIVYLCDGGSTDSTLQIAKTYQSIDSRIKILHSKQKLTFVENWNWSLKECKTEYFSWIGAHDLLHPNYFKNAIEILEYSPTATLVYPLSIEINVEDKYLGHADSDIETYGLNSSNAILKVASQLNSCTAIHGIFRSATLKRLAIKRILAFDFLILFLIGVYGDIRKTKEVLFYRRTVRDENPAETIKRYKTAGMFEPTKYHHYETLVKNCLIGYERHSRQPLISKIIILYKLESVLRKKFNLSRVGLLRCLLNI